MAEAELPDYTTLTVQLLSAYVAKNTVESQDLAGLIQSTRAALVGEVAPVEAPAPEYVPAVSVRKSLASKEYLISLIDGRPYKTLKRHLATHGLTPDQYRERYGLPKTYPMVAPAYADMRRAVAQKSGLGQRSAKAKAAAEPVAKAAPTKQPVAKKAAPAPSAAVQTPVPPVEAAAPVKAPKAKTGRKAPAKAQSKSEAAVSDSAVTSEPATLTASAKAAKPKSESKGKIAPAAAAETKPTKPAKAKAAPKAKAPATAATALQAARKKLGIKIPAVEPAAGSAAPVSEKA